MRPKYLHVETSGRDRWMISYLDVMTILLIFFIAVAAKSMDTAKAAEPAASPSQPIMAQPIKTEPIKIILPDPPPNPSRESIRRKLENYGLDWHDEPQGVVISLPQAVLFPPGVAQINKTALPTVDKIASVLQEIPNKVNLAGHADPIPIHNLRFKNNWELAAARGLELLNLLTSQYGIAEARFSIASYGSNDPKNPNDTPDGRAGNRRVEILILDEAPVPHS